MTIGADRIPVIIGVGQVNDRGDQDLDSLGLMLTAAQAAGDDCVPGLLARADWLGVVNQLSFPALTGHLTTRIAAHFGMTPAYAHETAEPTGDSPVLLIHEAANAIGRGDAHIALIVGGEALRTAGKRAQAALAQSDPAASGAKPTRGPMPKRAPPVIETRHHFGLNSPADIYPLFENALRPALGQTLSEGQAESGAMWASLSAVAAGNPAAWLRTPVSADVIATASADNRPIAHPYTKLMVANAAVNQGAAVIVTSLSVARAAGVPDAQIIYVARGAAAHEAEDPLVRPDFAVSAGMQVSLTRTLALNGLTVQDIDHVELYSCFPCVPKMAGRILGWPADRPISVVGGLTFGGGPIGNYMTHAAAAMVAALRQSGTHGLLFANGGYATHNHSIVLTRTPQPAGTFPQNHDYQADADALRGAAVHVDEAYRGPAVIETYTVLYNRAGEPRGGAVIGRASDGRRVIGAVAPDDAALVALLTDGMVEPVGQPGRIVDDATRAVWRMI